MVGPPVEVAGEHLLGLGHHRHRIDLGQPGLVEQQAGVDHLADRLLLVLGDAQQHPDRPHGDLRPQVGDEVEAVRPDQRVEGPAAEPPDLGLDREHLLRREHPGEDAAVGVVEGWVLEERVAGRQIDPELDELEQRSLRRAVRPPVVEAGLDVGVAAQREEVVRLVVVERRLLA